MLATLPGRTSTVTAFDGHARTRQRITLRMSRPGNRALRSNQHGLPSAPRHSAKPFGTRPSGRPRSERPRQRHRVVPHHLEVGRCRSVRSGQRARKSVPPIAAPVSFAICSSKRLSVMFSTKTAEMPSSRMRSISLATSCADASDSVLSPWAPGRSAHSRDRSTETHRARSRRCGGSAGRLSTISRISVSSASISAT